VLHLNPWQSGTNGQEMNVADLWGWSLRFSTPASRRSAPTPRLRSWVQVSGGTTAASGSLYGIPDWIAGAKTLAGAESNCKLTSFTAGIIQITSGPDTPTTTTPAEIERQ
jgi:hypothetical protein